MFLINGKKLALILYKNNIQQELNAWKENEDDGVNPL